MKAEKHVDEAGGQNLVISTWLHVHLAGEHGVCLDGAGQSGNGDHSIRNTASASQGSYPYRR